MIIGMCKWCGKDIEGGRNLLGCEMICETCQEAEDENRMQQYNQHIANRKVDQAIDTDIDFSEHPI